MKSLAEGEPAWRRLDPRDRARRVRPLRRLMARRSDELARRIADASGRPPFEALTQEVLPALEMIRYCERKLPRWLRARRQLYLRPGFLRSRHWVGWEPYGTVAVITPFNFPFSLGMMSATYLAIAGNTVAIKPSELVSDISKLMGELLEEAQLSPSIISVLEGGPEAGRFLAEADEVSKVVFFGSRRAGGVLADICSRRPIPFVLELGGGSTAIVMADADLDRAAAGIAWSGFYTGGYSCVGTDRVFVESTVEAPFLQRLVEESQKVWSEGIELLEPADPLSSYIGEALEEGARYIAIPEGFEAGHGRTPPGILAGVKAGSALFSEELFAPVIAVCTVSSAEEAARLANSGCQMLGASVWTRNHRRGRDLAHQLHSAMVWINDTSFGLPNLPWAGWGDAGWGSIFSRFALHEAARTKWISRSPTRGRRPWWPPYSKLKTRLARIAAICYRR